MKKVEIGLRSLYQKGFPKIYSVEKVRSLGIREGIPLKRWEKFQMGEKKTDGSEEH